VAEGAEALEVRGVTVRFSGLVAVDGVSLSVPEGSIVSLIGPNGAGKTSLINCVTGYYRAASGHVFLFGQRVTGWAAHRVARAGVARTYQNIELFRGMTVIDNLMLGRHLRLKSGLLSGGLYSRRTRAEELRERAEVEDLIDFLELAPVRKTPVGLLPYGLQKRVDLGRALALEPRVLVLDEPMAGMNLEEKEDIARFVLETRVARGVTVLLIEHDMGVVMDLSDHVAVLDFGRLIAEGPPDVIRNDAKVIEAYIGERAMARREGSALAPAGDRGRGPRSHRDEPPGEEP
jgi:branched-chain amino acid transport system ATP-binding protein